MMGQARLQGVVMGIRIGSKLLEVRGGDSEERRSRGGILRRRIHDRARLTLSLQIGAAGSRNGDWILLRGQRGLIGIEGRAQARSLGPYVANLQEPVLAQLSLDGEIPLLCRGGHPVQRHRQGDQAADVARKYRKALLGYRERTTRGREALEDGSLRHE